MQKYEVKLEAFEGPMDLLMHLIEKNKIDIYDIPIAELTQQYMGYLDKMREFNMEVASSFLLMAATLLQIKARMMLPKRNIEEEDVEDPRVELVRRILEYKKYKRISGVLSDMATQMSQFVARMPMDLPKEHLPPKNLSIDALVRAFHSAVSISEVVEIPSALVSTDVYRIQDKMNDLLEYLGSHGGRMLFSEAFSSATRGELIATFLAMLELLRLHVVTVQQSQSFSEIYISKKEGDVSDEGEF